MPNIRGPVRRKRRMGVENPEKKKETRLNNMRENLHKLVVAVRKKYIELDKTYEVLVEGQAKLIAKKFYDPDEKKAKPKALEDMLAVHEPGQNRPAVGPSEEEKSVNKIKLNLKTPFLLDLEEEEDDTD